MVATQRKKTNYIKNLVNSEGVEVKDMEVLCEKVKGYFRELFNGCHANMNLVLEVIEPCMTDAKNLEFLSPLKKRKRCIKLCFKFTLRRHRSLME